MTNVEEMEYFSRLTEVDRKRMVAQEHYLRTNYEINFFDNDAYDKLKRTPGRIYNQSLDPPNYDIFFNAFD